MEVVGRGAMQINLRRVARLRKHPAWTGRCWTRWGTAHCRESGEKSLQRRANLRDWAIWALALGKRNSLRKTRLKDKSKTSKRLGHIYEKVRSTDDLKRKERRKGFGGFGRTVSGGGWFFECDATI